MSDDVTVSYGPATIDDVAGRPASPLPRCSRALRNHAYVAGVDATEGARGGRAAVVRRQLERRPPGIRPDPHDRPARAPAHQLVHQRGRRRRRGSVRAGPLRPAHRHRQPARSRANLQGRRPLPAAHRRGHPRRRVLQRGRRREARGDGHAVDRARRTPAVGHLGVGRQRPRRTDRSSAPRRAGSPTHRLGRRPRTHGRRPQRADASAPRVSPRHSKPPACDCRTSTSRTATSPSRAAARRCTR